ncbi:MAG: VWA domain-containing protein [Candidatus Eisenbacteria bacterium]
MSLLHALRARFQRRATIVAPGVKAAPPISTEPDPEREREELLFQSAPTLVRTYRNLLRGLIRRMRRNARGARRGRRRRGVQNPYEGRSIRLVPYRPAENLLAPLPSILQAMRSGRMLGASGEGLTREDLRGWAKVERESLTLILLVDVSGSTRWYLRSFAEVLRSLAGHFHRNRDRMGLVAIQGRQASVLHHPTHNYRIVTRHLAKLAFRGSTPIADGLRKALDVARMERFRNPGSQSLVMLLSDCCPEPVAPGSPDLFEEPPYRDAQTVARLYAKQKVSLLVLLPTPRRGSLTPGFVRPGDRLAEAIARLSEGKLLRLAYEEQASLGRGAVETVLSAIESMFGADTRSAGDRVSPELPGMAGGPGSGR